MPIYHQVAVQFADLHDTPGRMQEKGVITVSVRFINSHVMTDNLNMKTNECKMTGWLRK